MKHYESGGDNRTNEKWNAVRFGDTGSSVELSEDYVEKARPICPSPVYSSRN